MMTMIIVMMSDQRRTLITPSLIWQVPDEGRPYQGLGSPRGLPRPRHRLAGDFLAGRAARARQHAHRKGEHLPEGSRHFGSRHLNPAAGRGDQAVNGERARWQRHDLDHWECAARLPHRSLPHHRGD